MASADFVVKQGDSAPSLTDTLSYSDGTPVNLTGCSVSFVMRALTAPSAVALTGTVAVVSALTGQVIYTPSSVDTSAAGDFMANWVVRFVNGQQMTFPTEGYIAVRVEENLTTSGGQQLVSLPGLKAYLNIPAEDHSADSKLVGFIEAVRPLIENIVGYVVPRTVEEWHDGGQYFIQPRRTPSTAPGTDPLFNLIAVEEFRGSINYPLAIVADPRQAGTYSVTCQPPLYTIERRTAGGGVIAFPPMAECVHIVYQVGMKSVPANIREAALETIRVNYQTTRPAGRGRSTVADEMETGPPLGFYMPRRAKELLAPNRRHVSIA